MVALLTCALHESTTIIMSTMIQHSECPEKLHRKLKARAALVSDYLLTHIRDLAEKPIPSEMLERLRRRDPISVSVLPADIIRKERDRR